VVAEDELTRERLPTAEAVITLGALAVRALQQHGVVTIFMNQEGVAEICAPGEIELDAFPEADAIGVLLDRGYQDEQLVAYLRGREARRPTAQNGDGHGSHL
jgi:hypothetical protein